MNQFDTIRINKEDHNWILESANKQGKKIYRIITDLITIYKKLTKEQINELLG
jgi:hypothetical protein